MKSLTLDFSPAFVQSRHSASSETKSISIGWCLQNRDFLLASTRYRCFYQAMGLKRLGVNHLFHSSITQLTEKIDSIDVLIIVNQLDPKVAGLVSLANSRQIPVFIDFCDDILAENCQPGEAWNENLQRIIFNGIAGFIDGIVTPTTTLAQRIKDYCKKLHLDTPVHVVPDVAETVDIFNKTIDSFLPIQPGENTLERIQLKPLDKLKPADKKSEGIENKRKSVLWFGQYGSAQADFGMLSLLKAIPALTAVNAEIPLELVIISNREDVYQAFSKTFKFPSRYIHWDPKSVYEELSKADVALLTTGNDGFSLIKSPNHVLQALSAGVPVVATSNPTLLELAECMELDNYEAGLRAYLGPQRGANIKIAMKAYQEKSSAYSLHTIAGKWLDIIDTRQLQRKIIPLFKPRGRVLFFFEKGPDLSFLAEAIKKCRAANVEPLISFTLAMYQNKPKFNHFLAANDILPSLFTCDDLENLTPYRLRGIDLLVVDNIKGQFTSRMIAQAEAINVPYVKLAKFTIEPLTYVPANPGPYPECQNEYGPTRWVFVTNHMSKGWILNAICREIGSRQADSWYVTYSAAELPPADNYFFAHPAIYLKYFQQNRESLDGVCSFVYYTHPSETSDENIAELLEAFNHTTKVVFMCSTFLNLWLERGLNPQKGCVVLGGADPEHFVWHKRGNGAIGISSAYYPRKNPDLLYALIKALPMRKFILLGRGWEEYEHFHDMLKLPNFEYHASISYAQYPEYYRQFDVYLSTSVLEGGPIPLLESMMSNVVPVASDTGFAPDIVEHGNNGFLFSTSASVSDVVPLIEDAFSFRGDIRETVLKYSWNDFSRNIVEMGK